jgi:hypothetical protein
MRKAEETDPLWAYVASASASVLAVGNAILERWVWGGILAVLALGTLWRAQAMRKQPHTGEGTASGDPCLDEPNAVGPGQTRASGQPAREMEAPPAAKDP